MEIALQIALLVVGFIFLIKGESDLFMFVFSSFLVCVLARRDHVISRRNGIMMLMTFLLYYGFIIYSAVI